MHHESCLSFIVQEIGITEAGWCSTKRSSYRSEAIAELCIHNFIYVQIYTHQCLLTRAVLESQPGHHGPSPRGLQGLILPLSQLWKLLAQHRIGVVEPHTSCRAPAPSTCFKYQTAQSWDYGPFIVKKETIYSHSMTPFI